MITARSESLPVKLQIVGRVSNDVETARNGQFTPTFHPSTFPPSGTNGIEKVLVLFNFKKELLQ